MTKFSHFCPHCLANDVGHIIAAVSASPNVNMVCI
jgi:hypothetical protein